MERSGVRRFGGVEGKVSSNRNLNLRYHTAGKALGDILPP